MCRVAPENASPQTRPGKVAIAGDGEHGICLTMSNPTLQLNGGLRSARGDGPDVTRSRAVSTHGNPHPVSPRRRRRRVCGLKQNPLMACRRCCRTSLVALVARSLRCGDPSGYRGTCSPVAAGGGSAYGARPVASIPQRCQRPDARQCPAKSASPPLAPERLRRARDQASPRGCNCKRTFASGSPPRRHEFFEVAQARRWQRGAAAR
jgi:hypothetical protein